MKLQIKPSKENIFPVCALLIKGKSPKVWVSEIQRLGLQISEIRLYPVPSKKANELYGCIVELPFDPSRLNLEQNQLLQLAYLQIFIPHFTDIFPQLRQNEINQRLGDTAYFYHPELGMAELKELAVADLFAFKEERRLKVEKPVEPIRIPSKVNAFMLEVSKDELMKEMENSLGGSDKSPPFDRDKLMRGNKKEIEKFLKLLESDPELALKYGIPLDTLNTMRVTSFDGIYRMQQGKDWVTDLFDRIWPKSAEKRKKSVKPTNWNPFKLKFNGSKATELQNTLEASKVKHQRKPYRILNIFLIFLVIGLLSIILFSNNPLGTFASILRWVLGVVLIGVGLYVVFKSIGRTPRSIPEKRSPPPQTTIKPNHSQASNKSRSSSSEYSNMRVILTVVGLVLLGAVLVGVISPEKVMPILLVGLGVFTLLQLVGSSTRNNRDTLNRRGSGKQRSSVKKATLLPDEVFDKVKQKYELLANEYIEKKLYEKAAYVYLQLLENPHRAAEILEQGEIWDKAAVMYLQKCQNKSKAAICFENARAYKEALHLYKELERPEKVGDMYRFLGNQKMAKGYFEKAIEIHKKQDSYFSASQIYKEKLKDIDLAQEMLLSGWNFNKEAERCLTAFFMNIDQMEVLKMQMQEVYEREDSATKLPKFMQVLKDQFRRDVSLEKVSRDLAYQLVAKLQPKNKKIVSELRYFNAQNQNLGKDVMLYQKK